MTDERLSEIETWANECEPHTTSGRMLRELVAEVRRLRAKPAPVYRYLKAFAVESGAHGRVMWTLQGDTPEPVPNADAVLAAVLAARKARTGAARELIPSGHNVIGTALFGSGPIPPFRGILDGITAADVYGVQV